MKRRKAIRSILLAGAASSVGIGGYEWYTLTKNPDKNYLLSKKALLIELAETIIPSTDTPGAKEAGAIEFMMPILMECTDTKDLNRFVKGLRELEDYTRDRFQREFTACNRKERDLVMQYFEEKSRTTNKLFEKIKNRLTGHSFFATLKTYTVYSYGISEKGASMGMRYIAVPGKYLPCIPMEPNQKAWATN